MEQLTTLLQGRYAYLLIFQILVVSSLFVLLLVMIVRRLKFETLEAREAEAGGKNVVSAEEHEKVKEQLEHLEMDLKNMDKLRADNTALSEKVKFLESKLLEYEILQEEIGSLSNLKVENEKLKKELLSLQKDISKTGSQVEELVKEADSEREPTELKGALTPLEPAAGSPTGGDGPGEPPNLDGLLADIDALGSGATGSGTEPKTP